MKKLFLFLTWLMVLPMAVQAQGGDSWETAALLTSGTTASGTLSGEVTDAWYQIEIPSDGTLDLEVTPDQTREVLAIWYTLLYDTYGKEGGFQTYRASCRAGNGYQPASLTVKDIGPGTYYLNTHRYSGEGGYTIKYVFTPNTYDNDKEPNEAYDQSILLEKSKELQGHLGFKDATSNTTDTDDWYKIEIPKDGTFTLDVTPDQTGEELVIWFTKIYSLKQCEDGLNAYRTNCQAPNGYDPASLTVKDMGKGTYYLNVHRYSGQGGYTIKYDFTPSPYANDEEYNNSYEQAQPIQNGETVKGHLGFIDADSNTADTDDWYKIEIPEHGRLTLDVVPDEDTRELVIWYTNIYSLKQCEDGLKTWRAQCRASNGYDPASLTVEDLGKGTYYLNVHRYSGQGGYTLKYEFEAYRMVDEEPNDDSINAIEIKDGETKEGFLGIIYDDGTTDADDWYMTTVAEGSQLTFSYVPDGRESLDVDLTLFYMENGELKNIVSRWPHWQSAVIETAENMKGGTYYFQIHRRGGVGAYSLTFGTPRRAEGSQIRVSFHGKNQVRLGIPSDYGITIENVSSQVAEPFILALPATEDIKLLGAKLPGRNGITEMTLDEITYEGADIMWFLVPRMDPHQKYSFTITAEGKVNAGVRSIEQAVKPLAIATTMLIAAAVGVVYDIVEDQVTSWCVDVIKENIDLSLEEYNQYRQVVGNAVDKTMVEEQQKSGIIVQAAKPTVKKMCTAMIETIPGGGLINAVGDALEVLKNLSGALRRRVWYWIYKDLRYIKEEHPAVLDAKIGCNQIVRSWDPNEMCGPVGAGEENWIGQTSTVDYRILFENKKEATAPAYRIRISDELDPDVFDLSSVRFGTTSHEGVDYNWKMTRDGNRLFWDIEGIELPPNVNAPEGEGYVTFSIDLKPGLGNMTQIKNKATIIFDYNEPIETNEYVNTLDLNEPVATMTSATEKGGVITVKCKAADAESGVRSYMFFVSVNDEPFEYIGDSTEPVYELEMGEESVASDFKFYALAVDNVGNTQQMPPAAITATSGNGGNGDANGDGEVNVADVDFIIERIGEAVNVTNKTADVNHDDEINVADVDFVIERIQ